MVINESLLRIIFKKYIFLSTTFYAQKTLQHPFVFCINGRLGLICPHDLIGSSTIRRGGFVGLGIALLEEVCHCGANF